MQSSIEKSEEDQQPRNKKSEEDQQSSIAKSKEITPEEDSSDFEELQM